MIRLAAGSRRVHVRDTGQVRSLPQTPECQQILHVALRIPAKVRSEIIGRFAEANSLIPRFQKHNSHTPERFQEPSWPQTQQIAIFNLRPYRVETNSQIVAHLVIATAIFNRRARPKTPQNSPVSSTSNPGQLRPRTRSYSFFENGSGPGSQSASVLHRMQSSSVCIHSDFSILLHPPKRHLDQNHPRHLIRHP